MHIQVSPLVAILSGVICAMIADSRGRSALGWFALGFFLPCLAQVILLVIPDEQEERRRRDSLDQENRRLREMVRKDRQVGDRRHEETLRRLDTHDRAIGIDTRGPETLELEGDGDAAAISPPNPPATPAERSVRQHLWFYVQDDERQGPVGFGRMRELWEDGVVDAGTLIWREGLEEWLPLAQLTELEDELRA